MGRRRVVLSQEGLFRNERLKAADILRNEIMPLVPSDEDKNYRDLGLLLGLDQESRQNQLLERCGNLPSARSLLFIEIKTMVLGCSWSKQQQTMMPQVYGIEASLQRCCFLIQVE